MSMVTPWRTLLLKSLDKNSHLPYAKYQQLATVRPEGRPANRTVVYRGFLGDTDNLTFVTDVRSRKVSELRASPWGEICWYFPETREQFRLGGNLTVIDKDCSDTEQQKARQDAWKGMSPKARTQFTWPDPGLTRNTDDQQFQQKASEEEPEANFCLVVVAVEEVDYLMLFDNYRMVFESSQDDAGQRSWSSRDVNP